jgi:hypothetical protein
VRRHVSVALLLVLAWAGVAPAQEWARKLFTDTTHDFGTVAKGAKSQFKFKFKNIYEEPLHVASVRSSCGCTSAEISKADLKTWETGDIVATFNTNSFLGYHSATITVTFDKPYFAEVQLQVHGNIRGDVTLTPGVVQLGTIDAGKAAEKKVTVTRTGRSDWTITDIRSANTNYEVEVSDARRSSGSVSYDLTVRLKPTAPVGYVNDQLFLVTNDSETTQIPVDVEGNVVAEVTVSPASLSLGTLLPGQSVTKNVVVRAKKAFKVLSVTGDDSVACKLPEAAREVQLLPITFTAGDKPGKVVKKLKIKTDLGDNAVPDITCQATILDPAEATPTAAPTAPATSHNTADAVTADGTKNATAGFRGK